MKSIFNKNTIVGFLCLAMGIGFSACSDWTENEALDVNIPNVEDIDPALYAKYLESIRNYKKTDHKMVYVWYDNSTKEPINRSHHLTALPDSIDVVALIHPDNLSDREIVEMEKVRNEKGMQIIFTVDYEAIKLNYENSLPEGETLKEDAFITHLTAQVNGQLALVDKYNYDGVSFKYNGKATTHMTEAELATYTKLQTSFVSIISQWKEGHSSKLLVFEGKPQNLLDKTILKSCQNIVIDGMSEVSVEAMAFNIEMAMVAGVPNDRFVVLVSTVSLDASDNKTGYFNKSQDVRAIPETAIWLAKPESKYTKSGIGIYNVQNDFFNPTLTYPYTRGAVNTLNPSPNN